MRKTCAKAVDSVGMDCVHEYILYTNNHAKPLPGEYKKWFHAQALPTLFPGLSTAKNRFLSLLETGFSTLSTPLITTTTISNKYLYSK